MAPHDILLLMPDAGGSGGCEICRLNPDDDIEVAFGHAARDGCRADMTVGATSIPGCVTKGDLDVVIRVQAADFAAA
jgi:hypothetical protein